jgi:hypothetical protein
MLNRNIEAAKVHVGCRNIAVSAPNPIRVDFDPLHHFTGLRVLRVEGFCQPIVKTVRMFRCFS